MKKLGEREKRGGNTIIIGARDEREEREEKLDATPLLVGVTDERDQKGEEQ
jgi:hypothetical protein